MIDDGGYLGSSVGRSGSGRGRGRGRGWTTRVKEVGCVQVCVVSGGKVDGIGRVETKVEWGAFDVPGESGGGDGALVSRLVGGFRGPPSAADALCRRYLVPR